MPEPVAGTVSARQVTEYKFEHPVKALAFIADTFSPITMESKLEQFWNTLEDIVITLLGIVIDVRSVQ